MYRKSSSPQAHRNLWNTRNRLFAHMPKVCLVTNPTTEWCHAVQIKLCWLYYNAWSENASVHMEKWSWLPNSRVYLNHGLQLDLEHSPGQNKNKWKTRAWHCNKCRYYVMTANHKAVSMHPFMTFSEILFFNILSKAKQTMHETLEERANDILHPKSGATLHPSEYNHTAAMICMVRFFEVHWMDRRGLVITR